MAIQQITSSLPVQAPRAAYANAPIKAQDSYGVSSLEKSALSKESSPLFSPPKLIPILHLQAMEKTYQIATELTETACEAITSSSEKIQSKMTEKALALQKVAQRTIQEEAWSILQMVGTCVLATYNIALGFEMLSSSPLLGGIIIAAGILSTANIAIEKTQGWNFIAEKLAKDNEDLRKQLLLFGPTVLNSLSLALSVLGTQVANIPPDTEKALKQALDVYGAFTLVGEGSNEILLIQSQKNLAAIQEEIFQENLRREDILSWLADLQKQMNQGWEEAQNFMQMYINNMRQLYGSN
jgi:hypothetical protein